MASHRSQVDGGKIVAPRNVRWSASVCRWCVVSRSPRSRSPPQAALPGRSEAQLAQVAHTGATPPANVDCTCFQSTPAPRTIFSPVSGAHRPQGNHPTSTPPRGRSPPSVPDWEGTPQPPPPNKFPLDAVHAVRSRRPSWLRLPARIRGAWRWTCKRAQFSLAGKTDDGNIPRPHSFQAANLGIVIKCEIS